MLYFNETSGRMRVWHLSGAWRKLCKLVIFFQMLHESIHDEVVEGLRYEFARVKIGDPFSGEFR